MQLNLQDIQEETFKLQHKPACYAIKLTCKIINKKKVE